MKSKPSVVVSGATSFTGVWIAKAFSDAGFRVRALCSRGIEDYEGLPLVRVRFLQSFCEIVEEIRAEDHSMSEWILGNPADLWIHHFHPMENYRSPQYDLKRAFQMGLDPLREIVSALAKSGYGSVIASGTIFEPQYQNKDLKLGTPYAQSKQQIWEQLKIICHENKIPVSKIVITDPIGPFENLDRMIPILIQKTLASHTLFDRDGSEKMVLRASNSIFDRIPAPVLGQYYVRVAHRLAAGETGEYRPSGFVGTNRAFLEKVSLEFLKNTLHWEVPQTDDQGLLDPIQVHCNTEAVGVNWPQFWREYAKYMASYLPINEYNYQ